VRIAQALGSERYALADVARLIARGALSFDAIKHLMAEPMSLDERTLDERMGEPGLADGRAGQAEQEGRLKGRRSGVALI
jgi:hypothetical protein